MFTRIRKLCHSGQTLMASLLNHLTMMITGFVPFGGMVTSPPQYIINMNLKLSQTKDISMANIYWAGAKAPKEEAAKALMKELVDCTDNRYYTRFESDGTGAHICAYVETAHTKDPSKFKWNKQLPPKFMGWRLVRIFVPVGYIDVILLAKERDDA